MMDTSCASTAAPTSRCYKDFKFVRHDLKLYLTDLAHRDEEYQHKFMRLAADYCATISDETLAMVYPLERICVHLIRRLDVAETLRDGRLPPLRLQAVDRPGGARRQGLLDGEVPRHARGPRGHGRHRDGLPPAAVQPDQPPQPGDLRAGRREPSAPRGLGGQPARAARPAGEAVAVGVAAQPGPPVPAYPPGGRLDARGRPVALPDGGGPVPGRRGARRAGAAVGPAAGDHQGRRHERHAVQHRPGDGVGSPHPGPRPARGPGAGVPRAVRDAQAQPRASSRATTRP